MVVSLNTLYFYNANTAVNGCKAKSQPGTIEMRWLNDVLKRARKHGMKVYLTGHVGPRPKQYMRSCYRKYGRLSLKYHDIILGHFYGHSNMDHFFFINAKDVRRRRRGKLFVNNENDDETFKDDKNIYRSFRFNQVDPYFVDAMKIKMVQGRSFQPNNTVDFNNSAIVNEAMVKEFGLKDPVGKKFGSYTQTIIGVMKDFNYESLHTAVQPLVLALNGDTMFRQSSDVSFAISPQPRISVRLKPGNVSDQINMLKKAWKKVAPNQDFEYHFLDETLAASYKQEQKMSVIVQLASMLSIFIACMGLFGLATLTVTRRTKEIGIRKVLGANVGAIVKLLSEDFVVLVIIASLVAFPVAWWTLQDWLSDFAYSINISWWVFITAAFTTIIIALVTVSVQTIKAALANPVKSLRTE